MPVLDLRRPELAAELGVEVDDLTGPRGRAHPLVGLARKLGAHGMVVPSAAREGAWNLVVFPSGFDHVRASGSRAMNPRPASN